MRSTLIAILQALLLAVFCATASAKPPLEAFSPTPEIHDMSISPDGKRVVWVQGSDKGDGLVERDLETGKVRALILADGREILGVQHLTDRQLLFLAYKVEFNSWDKYLARYGAAHIYDIPRDVSYRFEGFGRLVTMTDDEKRVFMTTRGRLLEVLLETGNIWSDDVGRWNEDNYAVSRAGKLLASQDTDRSTGLNRIYAAGGTDRRVLFEEGPRPADVRMLGLMPGNESLAVLDTRASGTPVIRSIDMTSAAMSEPLFGAGAETPAILSDPSNGIIGARLAGMYPRFEFTDATLTADARSLRASFPGQSVWIAGWSKDRNKLLLDIEGGIEPGRYAIFDRTARKITSLMQKRPSFPREDMGEVITIEYPARDGRKISAVVTWPARLPADQRKSLPLVVLPHDAPTGYSTVAFDWMVQFLANEGYAVLQPNYRGSGGQGEEHRTAGFDAFGRAMQHDITDGVHALVKMGWIDDDRVCIVGKGWGGYLALMGGAITPHRYRCVAAVSAVTDLPDFMKKRGEGDQRYDPVFAQWTNLLGDPEGNLTNQERYSPVNLARQFAAPVLLIHGELDQFAPDRQGRKMQQALEAEKKPVRLIVLDRENELLLKPENQQRVLRELAAFLAANMTVRAKPPPKPAD